MSNLCQHQLSLFRRQYLQLQADLKYPDPEYLRQDIVQQALLDGIFSDNALRYEPPQRYQLRTLKELIRRIEASITDWEEEVGIYLYLLIISCIIISCHSSHILPSLYCRSALTHCLRVSGYLRWSCVSIGGSISKAIAIGSNSSSTEVIRDLYTFLRFQWGAGAHDHYA
jgi:hypothetical protein